MVSIPSLPSGKLFQAFAVIGSIMLLISMYPYYLRNVNIPMQSFCSLVSCRALVVPTGMLLVAWITIVPVAKRTGADKFVATFHTTGAISFMLGYSLLEIWTLEHLWTTLCSTERNARRIAVMFALFFIVSFVVSGSL